MDSSPSNGQAQPIVKQDPIPLVAEIVPTEVESEDPFAKVEDLRKRILLRKRNLENQFIYMAADLYIVYNTEQYREWNYETFSEYVWNELGYGEATAIKYLNLWKRYNDIGVAPEKLHGIGYTKASMIWRAVKDTKSKVDWFEKARSLPYGDLRREVKNYRILHDPHYSENKKEVEVVQAIMDSTFDPEAPVVVNPINPTVVVNNEKYVERKFNLRPDQVQFVNTVLFEMRKQTGNDSDAYNLVCALQDMISGRMERGEDEHEKPRLFMRGFELRFGGTLVHLKTEEQKRFFLKCMELDDQNLLKGTTSDD